MRQISAIIHYIQQSIHCNQQSSIPEDHRGEDSSALQRSL
ncbi:hypothetical protein Pvag_pPag30533 (plasmid) [Pantoea vagans C9-1]|nr:hypothetical protein Pvag_pPag30533 [Pantoea vagans C9-1]